MRQPSHIIPPHSSIYAKGNVKPHPNQIRPKTNQKTMSVLTHWFHIEVSIRIFCMREVRTHKKIYIETYYEMESRGTNTLIASIGDKGCYYWMKVGGWILNGFRLLCSPCVRPYIEPDVPPDVPSIYKSHSGGLFECTYVIVCALYVYVCSTTKYIRTKYRCYCTPLSAPPLRWIGTCG